MEVHIVTVESGWIGIGPIQVDEERGEQPSAKQAQELDQKLTTKESGQTRAHLPLTEEDIQAAIERAQEVFSERDPE